MDVHSVDYKKFIQKLHTTLGPPGSGKTTEIVANCKKNDVIVTKTSDNC